MSKKKESSPPPVQTPQEQATQIQQARDVTDFGEAQRAYDIAEQYLGPYTQLHEDVRQQIFPGEQQVRNQLQQNILASLQQPSGITPEQQAAQERLRGTAVDRLRESMRTQANLGGNLYGGRSQGAEAETIANMLAGFAESDINREERARQNALSSAYPYLQMLFPGVGIQQPQFQSAVQSPDTLAQTSLSQRGQNMGWQQQQQQSQGDLYSSLFGGLGSIGGGLMGNPNLKAPWIRA